MAPSLVTMATSSSFSNGTQQPTNAQYAWKPPVLSEGARAKLAQRRRRREQPSLFHKSQKRVPLAAIAATQLNAVGNGVDYDLVKPTFKSYRDFVPCKVGGVAQRVMRTVQAPKELISFREIDKSAATRPLVELMEKEKAEKEKQKRLKELDDLFELDGEDWGVGLHPSIESDSTFSGEDEMLPEYSESDSNGSSAGP